MFEVLASVFGGFVFGSAINCIREGIAFKPFHSPKARAEFERTEGTRIDKLVKNITWYPSDLDRKWYDR